MKITANEVEFDTTTISFAGGFSIASSVDAYAPHGRSWALKNSYDEAVLNLADTDSNAGVYAFGYWYFDTPVSASILGNAATATKLESSRYIAGNAFDGTADIDISFDDLTDDAPSDGTGYVRKDGAWAAESSGSLTGFTASYDTALGVDAMPSLASPGTASNTALGYQALYSVVASASLSGRYNVAVGNKALFSLTGTTFITGSGNACVGNFAGYSITTGINNACVGNSAGYSITTGSNNACVGNFAGYRYGTGSSLLTAADNCVLIGNDARPLADNPSNEIVIGDTALGNGSNTATIGNSSITDTYLAGTVHGAALSLPGTTSQIVRGDGSIASVEGWTAPSLTNSWVNYGAGYNPAGYYKDPMGVVHLRGLIKSGTLAQSAFTLPTGYRPAYTEAFVVASSTTTGSGRLNVNSDGTVVPSSPSNNNFVSLDGITFRAA